MGRASSGKASKVELCDDVWKALVGMKWCAVGVWARHGAAPTEVHGNIHSVVGMDARLWKNVGNRHAAQACEPTGGGGVVCTGQSGACRACVVG